MSLKSGQLRFLTSDELYEIHMASLEILGQVGVKFLSQKALDTGRGWSAS
ncbi:MAG: hypothetical protein QW315_03740 [Candidatus Hadarchaeum sp.]